MMARKSEKYGNSIVASLFAVLLSSNSLIAGDIAAPKLLIAEQPELRRATNHAMRYYLIAPRADLADAARRRPVIVAIDGCGSDFKGFAEIYGKTRGSESFFIVCPCTFSNTNQLEGTLRNVYRGFYTDEEILTAENDRLAWDEAGLLAVLDDLAREFHAEERVFLTGFSGGGLLAYRMLFKHAGRVEAAAPVCANFFDDTSGLGEPRWTGREAALPIRLILNRDSNDELWLGTILTPFGIMASFTCLGAGAAFLIWRRTRRWRHVVAIAMATVLAALPIALDWFDPIDSQSASAIRTLRERGFTNVQVARVPGMGHTPAAERVISVFTATKNKSAWDDDRPKRAFGSN